MYLHVFEEFVEMINDHNAEELCSMMTKDHLFIDARGNYFSGMEKLHTAWEQYFRTFPDYWIDITEVFEKENVVLGVGSASGTYRGHLPGDRHNYFKIPAAFRAVIEGEKIKEWQVYADTKIPFDIIESNEKS